MIMNKNEILSLADIKRNFSIKDLFCNFKSGELSKWLLDNGYIEELNQVKRLSINDDMLLAKLCNILGINPNLTEQDIQNS